MAEASAETRSPHFAQPNTVQTYTSVHLPRVFEPWARILLEIVPPRSGEAVLDVATGPGTVARLAAGLVGATGRVTGVDLSPAMLDAARGRLVEAGAAPIEYVEASAAAVPLGDGSFDVAYCQQGLQHMADPQAALRELRRLLRPGGRLAVAVWTRSPFALFREIVAQAGAGSVAPPGRAEGAVDGGARSAGGDVRGGGAGGGAGGAGGGGPEPSTFGREAGQFSAALGEAGFVEMRVVQRELVVVLDGGIPQALQVAEATSAGPLLAALPPSGQQEVRAAIARALEAYVQDGAVHLPSGANIATAHTPA